MQQTEMCKLNTAFYCHPTVIIVLLMKMNNMTIYFQYFDITSWNGSHKCLTRGRTGICLWTGTWSFLLVACPERLWAIQSILEWALFPHEAYHFPESNARNGSGWSFVDSSLWNDTMLSETWVLCSLNLCFCCCSFTPLHIIWVWTCSFPFF